MSQENNVSSLQQHLEGGNISFLETSLNLEATVGFPYSDYEYFSKDWESKIEYDRFIDYGKEASSISGRVFDKNNVTSYYTTIILYNGKYYVQVELEGDFGGGTIYYTEVVEDYLSTLKYAYKVRLEEYSSISNK